MVQKHARSRSIDGVDADQMQRLIGGRRRYNRWRATMAQQRRLQVARLLAGVDVRRRGWRVQLAEELGVHRTTITRDFEAILGDARRSRAAAAENDMRRRQLFMHLLARCEDPAMFEVPT